MYGGFPKFDNNPKNVLVVPIATGVAQNIFF